MRTSDGVEGRFFFGALGSINGQPYYSYFTQLPDGALHQGRIDADYTYVYEDMAEKKGTIEVHERRVKESWRWINWGIYPHYKKCLSSTHS
ncbi:MAG: hypothetical protein UZ21_OP11001000193 [Microgenomates bacterium OLB22]|nr:MAG: hypothetical protein UZ21_OP11001000193 [Microgenomates bacterium OLB22]